MELYDQMVHKGSNGVRDFWRWNRVETLDVGVRIIWVYLERGRGRWSDTRRRIWIGWRERIGDMLREYCWRHIVGVRIPYFNLFCWNSGVLFHQIPECHLWKIELNSWKMFSSEWTNACFDVLLTISLQHSMVNSQPPLPPPPIIFLPLFLN